MRDWIRWAVREAKRLRWSFLLHWHSRKAKACRGDKERQQFHFRALITCRRHMDAVTRINPDAK